MPAQSRLALSQFLLTDKRPNTSFTISIEHSREVFGTYQQIEVAELVDWYNAGALSESHV